MTQNLKTPPPVEQPKPRDDVTALVALVEAAREILMVYGHRRPVAYEIAFMRLQELLYGPRQREAFEKAGLEVSAPRKRVSADMVATLRAVSGTNMWVCKEALVFYNGDHDLALAWLKQNPFRAPGK